MVVASPEAQRALHTYSLRDDRSAVTARVATLLERCAKSGTDRCRALAPGGRKACLPAGSASTGDPSVASPRLASLHARAPDRSTRRRATPLGAGGVPARAERYRLRRAPGRSRPVRTRQRDLAGACGFPGHARRRPLRADAAGVASARAGRCLGPLGFPQRSRRPSAPHHRVRRRHVVCRHCAGRPADRTRARHPRACPRHHRRRPAVCGRRSGPVVLGACQRGLRVPRGLSRLFRRRNARLGAGSLLRRGPSRGRRVAAALGAIEMPADRAAMAAYFDAMRPALRYDGRAREVLEVLAQIRLPVPGAAVSRGLFLGAGAALLPPRGPSGCSASPRCSVPGTVPAPGPCAAWRRCSTSRCRTAQVRAPADVSAYRRRSCARGHRYRRATADPDQSTASSVATYTPCAGR